MAPNGPTTAIADTRTAPDRRRKPLELTTDGPMTAAEYLELPADVSGRPTDGTGRPMDVTGRPTDGTGSKHMAQCRKDPLWQTLLNGGGLLRDPLWQTSLNDAG